MVAPNEALVKSNKQIRPKRPLVLVLDNVRSALNIGAIFRTADAFWIEKIYLCGISPVPPHPQITKTALGAEKTVPWEKVAEPLPLLKILQENHYQIIGIEQTPDAIALDYISKQKLLYPVALILGHEVFGVSDTLLQEVDMKVEIPQYGTKKSLNVATCAGIVLWEILKGYPN